jgi:hypothetical protein
MFFLPLCEKQIISLLEILKVIKKSVKHDENPSVLKGRVAIPSSQIQTIPGNVASLHLGFIGQLRITHGKELPERLPMTLQHVPVLH